MLMRLKVQAYSYFVMEPLSSSSLSSLFAAYKATLSSSFLKGLDMLSVEGHCIQNSWG